MTLGPYTQSGTTILKADGTPFIPHGITVSGLERRDWPYFNDSDKAEITAAAQSWNANCIRLQVGQELISDPAFLAALADYVALIESFGMAPIINLQAEWPPRKTPMPTDASKTFWRTIAPLYRDHPDVIFDIFNEPHRKRTTGGWACWHDGAIACPHHPEYVGMQRLAALVRHNAPTTLIWVDGPFGGSTLSHAADYPINISPPFAYSYHHPRGPHTEANWDTHFGYLVREGVAAVVNGEWTNWAARRGECWDDAPERVPAYLTYLTGLGIGMTIWKLGAWPVPEGVNGVLTTTDPNQPTGFGVWADWKCQDLYPHSAGKRLQQWFVTLP
jgi:cellulase (glycosyl hydrolase family 5)